MYRKSRLCFVLFMVGLVGLTVPPRSALASGGPIPGATTGASCKTGHAWGTYEGTSQLRPANGVTAVIKVKCFLNPPNTTNGNSFMANLGSWDGTTSRSFASVCDGLGSGGCTAGSASFSNIVTDSLVLSRWGNLKRADGTQTRAGSGHGLPDNYLELTLTAPWQAGSGSGAAGGDLYNADGFGGRLTDICFTDGACGSTTQFGASVMPMVNGSPTTNTTVFGIGSGDGLAFWTGDDPDTHPDTFDNGASFPDPVDACGDWTAAFTPSAATFLEQGDTQSVTLTRSADSAAAFPIENFIWAFNWTYGWDENATLPSELYAEITRSTRVEPASVSDTSVTINVFAWTDRYNDWFHVTCVYDDRPTLVDYARYRRGSVGGDGEDGPGSQRACAWLGVTFPARTVDTSDGFWARLEYEIPGDETLNPSDEISALAAGRELEPGEWTDVSVSSFGDSDFDSMSSPLPIAETIVGPFYMLVDLTGTDVQDQAGRWSVVCTDFFGSMRIVEPLVATRRVRPSGTRDSIAELLEGGIPTPVGEPLPGGVGEGGVGSGATDGAGTAGGCTASDLLNDADGNCINDDVDGIGFGGGSCDAGWGISPGSWGPALIKTARCMLVGLFVPDPDLIGAEFDALVAELEVQFPFSLLFALVDFGQTLGDSLESASGTGCFDMPGSFSFGSFSTSVNDVCIGEDMTVSGGQRELLAALMIAPLMWSLFAHATRLVRGV